MTDEERSGLIGHIAFHPEGGDIIPDTDGIRKLRWDRPGMGTRSGLRVIYFFYDLNMPVYLLAVYPKSQKIDLTQDEKSNMRHLAKAVARAGYERMVKTRKIEDWSKT